MRILFWAAIGFLAVVSVIFTIHNQADISLDLWPFPYLITLPLNLFVMSIVFGSLLFGAGLIWLSHLSLHQKIFKMKREAHKMSQAQQALQNQLTEAENKLLALQATEQQFPPSISNQSPPQAASSFPLQRPSLSGPF